MKKLLMAMILLATIGISCNKSEIAEKSITPRKTIKKTRKAKCDRDWIINVGLNGQPTTVSCPRPGNKCYRNKSGNHGCGEYADPKTKLAVYTNSNGTINTIDYVNNEDFTIMFPDIDQTLYNQIIDGELNLYKVSWIDETAIIDPNDETCDCEPSTFVLSSSSTIGGIDATNTVLIWAY